MVDKITPEMRTQQDMLSFLLCVAPLYIHVMLTYNVHVHVHACVWLAAMQSEWHVDAIQVYRISTPWR